MATVEQILTLTRNELGYRESPANSNRTKYGKWYGLDGNPWCMMFVMWIFHQAGASELLPARTASCGEFMRAAKKLGKWHSNDDLRPGDIVIFDFPGNSVKTDHVGFLEELGDDGECVMTLEGNTSMSSDDNGGTVMRRKRKRSLILGAYRPDYAAPQAQEPEPESLWEQEPESAWGTDNAWEAAPDDEWPGDTEKDSSLYDETELEDGTKVGEIVTFTGRSQFPTPYDDAEALPATPCAARLDAYCPGTAHPFQLYGAGIDSWANPDDVDLSRVASVGEAVETLSLENTAYAAKIDAASSLRVRSGPGASYTPVRKLSAGTVVTIVEEKDGFGELSGGGWVNLRYMKKLS